MFLLLQAPGSSGQSGGQQTLFASPHPTLKDLRIDSNAIIPKGEPTSMHTCPECTVALRDAGEGLLTCQLDQHSVAGDMAALCAAM